nr:unnamed protein product [Callosobruchus analis]
MGYLKAAKVYNVPRTTLFRLSKEKGTSTEGIIKKKVGRKPVFNEDLENMLVQYVLVMEEQIIRVNNDGYEKTSFSGSH